MYVRLLHGAVRTLINPFILLMPPCLPQVSVAAGAILAGASPEEVKACETYALDIGLAFQGGCVLRLKC